MPRFINTRQGLALQVHAPDPDRRRALLPYSSSQGNTPFFRSPMLTSPACAQVQRASSSAATPLCSTVQSRQRALQKVPYSVLNPRKMSENACSLAAGFKLTPRTLSGHRRFTNCCMGQQLHRERASACLRATLLYSGGARRGISHTSRMVDACGRQVVLIAAHSRCLCVSVPARAC